MTVNPTAQRLAESFQRLFGCQAETAEQIALESLSEVPSDHPDVRAAKQERAFRNLGLDENDIRGAGGSVDELAERRERAFRNLGLTESGAKIAAEVQGAWTRIPGRCNAEKASGTGLCRNLAGSGTTHPGSGHCSSHETSEAAKPAGVVEVAERFDRLAENVTERAMARLRAKGLV